jgi:flagellar M-ring protein FliF
MDFVNKAYAQAYELFRSLSPGARVVAGLLLAGIVVSLVYLFQFQVSAGDEFLLGGRPFSASELTAIEAAFAKAGLSQSVIDGNRIRIPRGQKAEYLAALADSSALPADFYNYLDEATAADNPFSSTKSMEMRRWNAKQKELALIIARMRGIESATVQFDEEIKSGLTRQKHKTAMVAVQTTGGALEDGQLKAIRNVIASAYAGLDRNDITITDMTSGLSFGGAPGPGGVPEGESIYATHKTTLERFYQRKIADQLAMIPGVIVGINAELNPELEHSIRTVKLDPKPVPINSRESTKESTTTAPQVSGRPGAVANGVGNQAQSVASSTGSGGSTLTESQSDIQTVPGFEESVTDKVGLIPTIVTASIEVPASYFLEVWRQRNPPAAGATPKEPEASDLAKIETETTNRIKETVRNLLPPVAQGTNPYPHIVVSTYTDLPGQPAAEPSLAATSGTWLADNWQTLAVIGVGLISLLMLRSMIRSPATSPRPAAASTDSQHAGPRLAVMETDSAESEGPEPEKVLRRRFQSSGPDLRAELQEIVKENPDAAATILRAWIGEAA